MLGLSATMERKDGLTPVFKMFLGDIVYSEKREDDDPVLIKGIEYNSNNDEVFDETMYDYRGNPAFSSMITKICSYNHRTEFILKVLKKELEIKPDQQIMILAHNRNLFTYLYQAIETRGIATVGYYVGGYTSSGGGLTSSIYKYQYSADTTSSATSLTTAASNQAGTGYSSVGLIVMGYTGTYNYNTIKYTYSAESMAAGTNLALTYGSSAMAATSGTSQAGYVCAFRGTANQHVKYVYSNDTSSAVATLTAQGYGSSGFSSCGSAPNGL